MNIKLRIILLFVCFVSIIFSQDCCDEAELANDDCGGIGCYIPQCTENCEWEPMQCWGSTGYCWCVDVNGVEIEGTSMPSWQGFPECEEFNSSLAGDVNGDEQINVLDIVLIIGFIVGVDIPSDSEFLSGDYNEDGELNVLDIVAIIDLILSSEEEELPEECYLNPDPGPCMAAIPAYYYDLDTNSCTLFVWGGVWWTGPL